MATRVKAFDGRSQAGVIAAILEQRPPPISTLQRMSPRLLDDVVERCLAKDPEERWQTAADLTFALARIRQELAGGPGSSGGPTALPQRRAWWGWSLAAAAGVSVLASLVLLVWLRASGLRAEPPPVSLLLSPQPVATSTTEYGELPGLAISRDGQRVAYVAEHEGIQRLYLREMHVGRATLLHGTENAIVPFFAPDGRRIGFFADGQLKIVGTAGGAPVVLADAVNPRGGTWGTDDTIIYSPSTDAGLWQVAAAGGPPRPLAVPDPERGERSYRWPVILPGDDALIFTLATSQILSFDDARLVVRSLATGEHRELIRGGSAATFVEPGLLLYARGGALHAVPFDSERQEISGVGTTVLDDVTTYPLNGGAQYALASNGTLVYVAGGAFTREATLTWVDRTGTASRLNVPPLPYNRLSLSPDGRHVALDIDGANASIWILDLSRSSGSVLPMTRLTLEWSNNLPFWSPDGTRVGFISARRGIRSLFWQSADGQRGPERLVVDHEADIIGASASPDGRTLMFEERRPATGSDLWITSVAGDGKPTPFAQTAFNEQAARFSPDGLWVAYVSDEAGRDEVFVQPFPGPGRKWRVSTGGGTEPVWARSGRELFYWNGDALMVVTVETSPAFSAAEPELLFRRKRGGSLGLFRRTRRTVSDDRRFAVAIVRNPGDGGAQLAGRRAASAVAAPTVKRRLTPRLEGASVRSPAVRNV